MAKKKRVEYPKHELTRHQLSRWQKQQRRQRIIFYTGLLIVVAVLAIIGVGVYTQWYVPEYKPLHETVIEVNDTKFNMDYYVKTLGIYSEGSVAQAYGMVDEVVTIIQSSELMRQEAAEMGISVSDSEVRQKLENYDTPLSEDYTDLVRTDLLVAKLLSEHFEYEVPNSGEQRQVKAMFLESEAQLDNVEARMAAGENFDALARELSLDAASKERGGEFGWCPEDILTMLVGSPILEEHAFGDEVELGVLSQPIYDENKIKTEGYWLVEVLGRDFDSGEASFRAILLPSEQEADEVRAKLEAGEDFAELAKEFSQHADSSANGGEFESVPVSLISFAFDDFVLESELGVVSQPIWDDEVETTGGYWLAEVIDIDDNKPIEGEYRELLKTVALDEWVRGLMNSPENRVVSYLDEDKKLWAISQIS